MRRSEPHPLCATSHTQPRRRDDPSPHRPERRAQPSRA